MSDSPSPKEFAVPFQLVVTAPAFSIRMDHNSPRWPTLYFSLHECHLSFISKINWASIGALPDIDAKAEKALLTATKQARDNHGIGSNPLDR
jgi:hypothetical protein